MNSVLFQSLVSVGLPREMERDAEALLRARTGWPPPWGSLPLGAVIYGLPRADPLPLGSARKVEITPNL